MNTFTSAKELQETQQGEGQSKQRLKAAVWHAVGKMCTAHESTIQLTVTPQFIAALSEMVYYHMERLGQDLEAFAQHANRSTIKVDDVKLYARHNEEMCQFLQQIMDEQKAKDDKDARPRGRKRKIEAPSLDP